MIDFERVPGVSRDWILDHVRAGKEVFRDEVESAGVRYVDEVDIEEFDAPTGFFEKLNVSNVSIVNTPISAPTRYGDRAGSR